MISVIRLYNTANQRALAGTTGFDDQDKVNSKIADVQTELIEYLATFYEANQQVKDALAPFVKYVPLPSDQYGVISKPADYVHVVAIGINDYPCDPINVNEEFIIKQSPIRRPSAEKNLYYHLHKNNAITILPEQQYYNINFGYIRQPALAMVVLNTISTDDSDYYEAVSSNQFGGSLDLEWPESMFNLILYLYLEKMGIEQKENILLAYSAMGIARETPKTSPQV
jgi:hypothetical protein